MHRAICSSLLPHEVIVAVLHGLHDLAVCDYYPFTLSPCTHPAPVPHPTLHPHRTRHRPAPTCPAPALHSPTLYFPPTCPAPPCICHAPASPSLALLPPAGYCDFPVADRADAVQQWIDAVGKDPSLLQGAWILLLECDYVWLKPIKVCA